MKLQLHHYNALLAVGVILVIVGGLGMLFPDHAGHIMEITGWTCLLGSIGYRWYLMWKVGRDSDKFRAELQRQARCAELAGHGTGTDRVPPREA